MVRSGWWEVVVDGLDRRAERRLGGRLRSEGFPVCQGFLETRILVPSNRRVAVPFEDRAAAEELGQRLRIEAGPGARVAVKRVSALRAWLIRQELFGNYGE